MLIEFSLFILELLFGLAFPALMTLKSTSVSDNKSIEHLQCWTFYWIAFIFLNSLSWTFDFFFWTFLKTVALIALTLPQLSLSHKASNYLLGPFQELIHHQYINIRELAKQNLA